LFLQDVDFYNGCVTLRSLSQFIGKIDSITKTVIKKKLLPK